MEDVVQELGFLCLGSRLKRIGDRVQSDTQRIIDEAGLDVQAGQYPLLAALDRLGPLTVGELVEALGVSQPGVTQMVTRLELVGLISIERDAADRRRRTISLSPPGKRLVATSKQKIWPRIEAAVRDACGDKEGALIDLLASLESELERAPLGARGKMKARCR